ncbi:hypothetical protein WANA31_0924 [Wolbachia endosymbiont of Drosophila ananassae]|nr:hypothetical protein WANA31_0924 [Wolbachia endosymbiont of Drosophila ananassae]
MRKKDFTSSKVTGKDSGLDLRCTDILGEVDLIDIITLLFDIARISKVYLVTAWGKSYLL